jgi:uncharacterized OB-fold protein
MSQAIPRPLPRPDRDSEPYWAGLRAGELRVQRCRGCGTLRWPARAICNRCYSFEAEWVALSGHGTVVSWIRTHQPFLASFKDELPYVTVQVQLAEQSDIQPIGGFARGGVEPRIGMPVRAVFQPAGEAATLLMWEPAEG